MDSEQKELFIKRFCAYLESVGAEPDPSHNPGESPGQTDLYALFVELAGLRNEVKLESRQVKTALDEFKQLFELAQRTNTQLSEELSHSRAAQEQQNKTRLRPLLLELLDFYDRLGAGLRSIRDYQPAGTAKAKKPVYARLSGRLRRISSAKSPVSAESEEQHKHIALFKAFAEAQEISLRRLEQLLASQQVNGFSCTGRVLDPHTMRVIETAYDPHQVNGVVLEEIRRGFHWGEQLLRPAEVKVNKHPQR